MQKILYYTVYGLLYGLSLLPLRLLYVPVSYTHLTLPTTERV